MFWYHFDVLLADSKKWNYWLKSKQLMLHDTAENQSNGGIDSDLKPYCWEPIKLRDRQWSQTILLGTNRMVG